MEDKRSNPILIVSVVVALLLVVVVAYVGGYFLLGTESEGWSTWGPRWRVYPQEWMMRVFAPMARLEGLVTGIEHEAVYFRRPPEP